MSCAASQISRCAYFSDLVRYLCSAILQPRHHVTLCMFTLKALLEKYCVQCFESECAEATEAAGAQEAKNVAKKY